MIDRDRLREALADVDYMEATGVMVAKAGPIIEAARLVVEGREVWWCEEHDQAGGELHPKSYDPNDCRMVRMILIDGEK